MTAVHLNNPQFVIDHGDFWGSFHGVEGTMLLSLASIIFALLIATIPMTARRILDGGIQPHRRGHCLGTRRGIESARRDHDGGCHRRYGRCRRGWGWRWRVAWPLAADHRRRRAADRSRPPEARAMAGGGGVIPGVNSPLTAPPHTPPASPGGTRWFAVVPGGANMPFNLRVNGRRYS